MSRPFPPLLTVEEGEARIEFEANASGDTEPLTFRWDLDGDGEDEAGQEMQSLNGPIPKAVTTQQG